MGGGSRQYIYHIHHFKQGARSKEQRLALINMYRPLQVLRPVCGSDSVTYDNECELRRQSCLNKRPVTVSFVGECSEYSFYIILATPGQLPINLYSLGFLVVSFQR